MEIAAKSPVRMADTAAVREAARLLRAGKLVAFPTETVYGLGADATNDHAVADIFAAKERPRFNPLIVHVANLAHAQEYSEFHAGALRLAKVFWPGALTLVLARRAGCALSQLVSAGLDTVALRAPAHSIAQELLAKSGLPIAAPSANASGRISATTAEHVRASLGDKVELILDAGPTALGLESTVIGFDEEKPVLLRLGAISRREIEEVVGRLEDSANTGVRSPGQLASHYAPRASVRLNATSVRENEALLAFGRVLDGARVTLNLSENGDVREAAVNLFAHLHTLDVTGLPIAVMPIPLDGLGEAINDRLLRAAAKRDQS
ncbi:MAG TPA: L-threonylcarbamoyladenylate synthase [Rhizomicrobium sp.]|nr:L-threonylcarbamoyladenylate synthase [Rhizomicrobium sp.]